MINDLPIQYRDDEIERNAYNAAFYELGLRWHWDRRLYDELLGLSQDAAERICHYVRTWQPHLLTAYDVAFLADLIEVKKGQHIQRSAACANSNYFDWAQARGAELGT
ncbi:hypothetical protein [Variovorax sp. KK3]|uniref:hypothetical protein n=1 Tax=Variovorax sp. KK3 TaxID=1855728 RepID=UPI00097BE9F4|nr:hypothetical protein [Variovorax sp. KK3]